MSVFSVMPADINMKIIPNLSHKLFKKSFLLQKFFEKTLQIPKHEKRKTSLTRWCASASHRRVELHGVHPTTESSSKECIPLRSRALWCVSHRGVKWSKFLKKLDSTVCIAPWSQAAHPRVKIELFVSLWLLLKGQSGEILLAVNTYIMK